VTTLHYIFDPICGWCYAAAPLVEAARSVPNLVVAFHGGGMLAGSRRRTITAQWRNHVTPHDRRIAELSGQPFEKAYLNGLLYDETAILDSEPPITAILAAEAVAQRGLDMVHAVQRAFYVEGRRISDVDVLRGVATRLDLPVDAFDTYFNQLSGAATLAHIAMARDMLDRVGGNGFPTFALENAQGNLTKIEASAWLGRPGEWTEALRNIATSDI
jgi:putative protein-disulfide isomerase